MTRKKAIFVEVPTSLVLQNAVRDVWQEIGSDCLACCDDEPMTNEGAIETCLDADRLDTFGYKNAEEEMDRLMDSHSFSKIVKSLAIHVKLI